MESLSRGGDGNGGDEIVSADDRVIPGSAVGGGILAAAVRAMIRAPAAHREEDARGRDPRADFRAPGGGARRFPRGRARRRARRRKTPSGRGGRRRDARGGRSALFPPALARRAPARDGDETRAVTIPPTRDGIGRGDYFRARREASPRRPRRRRANRRRASRSMVLAMAVKRAGSARSVGTRGGDASRGSGGV